MYQLRAAARGALCKIALLEEQGPITTRRGVDGRPESRRAPSDDDDIPFPTAPDRSPAFVAVHGDVALPVILPRSLERNFELLESSRKFRRLKAGFGFACEEDERLVEIV